MVVNDNKPLKLPVAIEEIWLLANHKKESCVIPENTQVVISVIPLPLKSSARNPVYKENVHVAILVIHLLVKSHCLSVDTHHNDSIFPPLSCIAKTGDIANTNNPRHNQIMFFVFCIRQDKIDKKHLINIRNYCFLFCNQIMSFHMVVVFVDLVLDL